MDVYTVSILVFLAFLALFFYKDRKNVERQGVLLLRKTKKGRKEFGDNNISHEEVKSSRLRFLERREWLYERGNKLGEWR